MTSSFLFASSCLVFKETISSSSLLSCWINYTSSLFKSSYLSLRLLVKIFSLFSASFLYATISASKDYFSSNWLLHASSILLASSNWNFRFVIIQWTSKLSFRYPFFILINSSLSDLFFLLSFIRSSKVLINSTSRFTMPSCNILDIKSMQNKNKC